MRLALAQINTVVGDLDGNRARILDRLDEARGAGADLVLFPELAVTGYPPEDLLLRPGFIRAARRSVEQVAAATKGIVALVGAPHLDTDLYNACFVLADGEIRGVYRKRFLPNYGVFDENRYFAPGNDLLLLASATSSSGRRSARTSGSRARRRPTSPSPARSSSSTSRRRPFHVGKDREREEMLRVRARDNSCFVALCNAVGGQDELIFDGGSVVLDDEGELIARAPSFEEALLVVDLDPAAAVGTTAPRRPAARSGARSRPRRTGLEELELGTPRPQSRTASPESGAAARRPRADAARARARPARLRRARTASATS